MKYEILTSRSMLDVVVLDDDNEVSALTNEQFDTLEKLGFDATELYIVVVNGRFEEITNLLDAPQYLALKEGADLVRFEDGSIGYIGYYGSRDINNNNLKIIGKANF